MLQIWPNTPQKAANQPTKVIIKKGRILSWLPLAARNLASHRNSIVSWWRWNVAESRLAGAEAVEPRKEGIPSVINEW
jgi:hypothetical protein